MKIREYRTADCAEIADLFYATVHTINAKDYTKSQLDVWATGKIDIVAWDRSFTEHDTLVAEKNDMIVGFGDMDHTRYLDRLFVHKDYQGKGIATAILNALEQRAAAQSITAFTTYASITAKPFFEKHDYLLISGNTVVRNGVELTNFLMKKHTAK